MKTNAYTHPDVSRFAEALEREGFVEVDQGSSFTRLFERNGDLVEFDLPLEDAYEEIEVNMDFQSSADFLEKTGLKPF